MKRLLLAAALLAAGPAAAQTRLTCGTVDSLEVTSLTRTSATAFLRVALPRVPPGSKSFFEGKIEVANTPMPVGLPVTVMVQHAGDSENAVLLVDLDLARIPSELLGRLHAAALDVTFDGHLRTSPGAEAIPVCAAGVLRIGTAEIRSSGPLGRDFARFSGARFSGLSLSETQGEATVVLYNPLSFPLDIKDLVYEIRTGDRRVAAGERHGLRLHPGRENAVALPLVADNTDLVAALAGAALAGGRVEGRLVARISVRVGKDQTMTIPLDLPGAIQVAR
jgi:LEA14-like dessication related protein